MDKPKQIFDIPCPIHNTDAPDSVGYEYDGMRVIWGSCGCVWIEGGNAKAGQQVIHSFDDRA